MVVDAKVSEAIDAAERKFIDAIQKGDFDAAGSVFGEDAVLMPPGTETVLGRPSIQAFWGRGRRFRGAMLTPASRKTLGPDLVREVGAMRLSIIGPRQRGRELSCKYAFVWQLVGDLWTIETCVWNRVAGSNAGNQRPRAGGGRGRPRGGGQDGEQGGGQGGVRRGGAAIAGAPGGFAAVGGAGGGQGPGQRRFQGGGRFQGEDGDGQSGGRFQGRRRFQGGAGGGQGRSPGRGQDPFGSDFDE